MKREKMHSCENSDKEKLIHSVSDNGLGLNNDDASDDNKFAFPDPEFFYFGKLRDASQFRANQIWTVYDDQGCMPRFCAQITRVKVIPKFMLHFVWLEFNPAKKAEEAWSSRGLPVACGQFKLGQSDTTNETGMFSRTISSERRKTNNFYEIYPRKGEVWALFKGWDIGWSSDAGNSKKLNHQFDVVQVLSDLTTSTSITVMPLVKIKGYVSLFMQSGEAAPYVIPQGETLRFSHCVPHHLMSGTEKVGIPGGSLELDPAALPSNLEEAFPSANPECSSVRSQDRDSKHAGSSSGDRKGSMNVEQGQHRKSVNAGIPTKTPEEEKIKYSTHLLEVTDVNSDDDNDDAEGDDNTVEDDLDSPALKRLRKNGLLHGDQSNKTAKLNEDIAGHNNGPVNGVSSCSNMKDTTNDGMPCGEKTFNLVEQKKRETMHAGENSDGKEKLFHSVSTNGPALNDDDASDDRKYTFQDPEFFDFDQLRDVNQFRANQIWAVYDDRDCMPRFYARSTRVQVRPKFMLHFVWLNFDPANKAEKAWSYKGLPDACGHFKHGHADTTKENSMFSRTISFERSKIKNCFEIYPRKGEVWALFKGWDIGWSSDTRSPKKLNYQYEVVQVPKKCEYEILPRLGEIWAVYKNWGPGWTAQDYENCEYELVEILDQTDSSIQVQRLRKVDGYKMVFMSYRAKGSVKTIRKDEYPKFSHQIPCFHLPYEKRGKLRGYLELDPLSVPQEFIY